jgi:hypothetical protein
MTTAEGEQVLLLQGRGWWALARPGLPDEDLRVAGRIPRDKLEGAERITYDDALGLIGRPLPVPSAFHGDEGAGSGALEGWVGRRPLLGLLVGIVLYVVVGAFGLWLAEAAFGSSVWVVFIMLFAAIFLGALATVLVAVLQGGFWRGCLFGAVYGLVLALISLALNFARTTPAQLLGLAGLVTVAALGGGVGSRWLAPRLWRNERSESD